MDKLKMQSADGVQDNIQKIAALFPNCVTETVVGYHDDGSAIIKQKVDFEKLQQELKYGKVDSFDTLMDLVK